MKQGQEARFEIQPVLRSVLPDVADFLQRCYRSEVDGLHAAKSQSESVESIERRLRWLLVDSPVASADAALGYCVRDDAGIIRGLNLSSPAAFRAGGKQLLGLCSGTFLVEPMARLLGFYLFKKCLSTPGYSFYFASTCNAHSSRLWEGIGASVVPHSEIEYILPLRLDVIIAAYVAYRTSNLAAARFARMCSRTANPILRLLSRPSAKLSIEPCQDWDKLAELARRHASADHITSDRSPAYLRWRYGAGSPLHPCRVYLFRDPVGNEGWFSLGFLVRGDKGQFRSSVLLDTIWPRQKISYKDLLQEILRVTAARTDAISFRWRPGLDDSEISRCVYPRKLPAPRAYVSFPKGTAPFPLELVDYDDSDFVAWNFPWSNE